MRPISHSTHADVASVGCAGEVLASAPAGQAEEWAAAFAGFQEAWRLSWHLVGRHGCLVIPQDFQSLKQTMATPICFSLPGPDDEGVCSNALADYLIRVHNDVSPSCDESSLFAAANLPSCSTEVPSLRQFVARIDQVLLMRGQDVQRHDSRKNEVSSRFLTAAHCLAFDTDKEVTPHLKAHCVHHTVATGEMVYDFGAAEKFLIDRYFYNKPLLNLALPGFAYADGIQAAARVSLAGKVPQEELSREQSQAVRRELTTPAAAQLVKHCLCLVLPLPSWLRYCAFPCGPQVLRRLDSTISFLAAVGGSSGGQLGGTVGDLLLATYLSSVRLKNLH